MKKSIIFLLIAGTLFMTLLTGCRRDEEEMKKVSLENLKRANKQIEKFLTSDKFEEADEEERLEIAIETVDKLVEEKVIEEKSVYVLEDVGVITFKYEGGGAGVIETKDISGVVTEDVQLPVETFEETPSAAPVETPSTVPYEETAKKTEKFSIRVYNAFEDDDYRNGVYKILLNNWIEAGLDSDNIILDNEVYVEELLEIPNYTMVSFSMHGSYCYGENREILPVIVLLDDKMSEERDKELQKYIGNYEVAKFYSSKGSCYAVFPQFFSDNFSKHDFKNTIVYSESCLFLGGCVDHSECDKRAGFVCETYMDIFPETLCKLGCPAVIGFHNSVYADYANNGLYVLGATLNGGYSPEDAFYNFINEYGETDRVNYKTGFRAYPLLFGENVTCTVSALTKCTERDEDAFKAFIDDFGDIYVGTDVKDYADLFDKVGLTTMCYNSPSTAVGTYEAIPDISTDNCRVRDIAFSVEYSYQAIELIQYVCNYITNRELEKSDIIEGSAIYIIANEAMYSLGYLENPYGECYVLSICEWTITE